MRLSLRFLPAAVLGMAMLASCHSTSFHVPKIGTRFEDTKKYLDYDTSLNTYVIPLERYETLEYDHFVINIPKDDVVEYYAPVSSNSSNYGELFVRNLPVQTDFFGRAIYAQNMEGWNSLADIQKFYKESIRRTSTPSALKRASRSATASTAWNTTSWRVCPRPASSCRCTDSACSTRRPPITSSTSGQGAPPMKRTSTTIS